MTVAFRRLKKEDLYNGYTKMLSQLTHVGDVTINDLLNKFDVRERAQCYHTFIGEVNGTLACTGTLFVEEKFIHQCSRCGHIEDIVVNIPFRGTGVGKKLIGHLIEQAKKNDCYKVILDCDDKSLEFYQSCNFHKHANQMSLYFKE